MFMKQQATSFIRLIQRDPSRAAHLLFSKKPHASAYIQLIRSFGVSVIALIFDFGLLIFFKQVLGIHYIVAATLSFLVGVIVNYALSVWWVFPDHKLASKRAEFLIFLIITGTGLALNLIIIAALVQGIQTDYRVAKAISTIVVFFWNFLARKRILY